MGTRENGSFEIDDEDYFGSIDRARVPIRYMARLFAAGNESIVRDVVKRLIAVRLMRRQETVGDSDLASIQTALSEAGLDADTAEAIYRLTSLATLNDRFNVPPYHREMAIEMMEDPLTRKQSTGVGRREAPTRGP